MIQLQESFVGWLGLSSDLQPGFIYSFIHSTVTDGKMFTDRILWEVINSHTYPDGECGGEGHRLGQHGIRGKPDIGHPSLQNCEK